MSTAPSIIRLAPSGPAVAWQVVTTVAARAADALHRLRAEWRHDREVRDTHVALMQLNDHTLRDLGLHRSEISSFAVEVHGDATWTRARPRARLRAGVRLDR